MENRKNTCKNLILIYISWKNIMDITQQLKNFYNSQAQNFSVSRQKHWPDFDIILQYIKDYIISTGKTKLKILELGCGDGRFYRFLKKNLDIEFEYIGVDISDWLIQIARSYSPNTNFIVADMVDYLTDFPSQAMDIVVSIASFQHIPRYYQRLFVLKNIYRILVYEWLNISLNWSFSRWFVRKYWKQLIVSMLKFVFSFWYRKWNDLSIPWKDTKSWKIYKRYYHIFLLSELEKLFKMAWFVIIAKGYIWKSWSFETRWHNARNTLIVGKKDVLKT